jgi:hypothetical protein
MRRPAARTPGGGCLAGARVRRMRPVPGAFPMRVLRPCAAAAALAVLLAAGAAHAKPRRDLDAKQAAEFFKRARAFFDPQKDLWKSKKDLREYVDTVAATGTDVRKDLKCLSAILYQGRNFLESFSDKDWRTANDVKDFDEKGPYKSVFSERLRFTFVLPTKYPKPADFDKPQRQFSPFPLLFSLHEEKDFKPDPKWHTGAAVLQRRYPKADFATLYQDWLMFAPVASKAQFTEPDGSIRSDFVTVPLAHFWRRYHVDFNRIVLDGADAAFSLAAAQPNFFAGIVLWGGKVDPELVKNFAPVPVYVVGDEALEKALKDAGHPSVTRGDAAGIPGWIGDKTRTQPEAFHWNMKRPADQQQAYWVSILSADTSPGVERTLDVKVDRPGNKVEITAKGITEIAVYLNDEILNLDDEVEVVVNGKSVHKEKLARNFDDLLPTKDPMKIQKSLYLGWLYPAQIQRIVVPSPEAPPAPADGTSTSTPPGEGEAPPPEASGEDEQKAEKYWEKALEKEAAGDLEGAKALLNRILALGPNAKKADAEKKLAELAPK